MQSGGGNCCRRDSSNWQPPAHGAGWRIALAEHLFHFRFLNVPNRQVRRSAFVELFRWCVHRPGAVSVLSPLRQAQSPTIFKQVSAHRNEAFTRLADDKHRDCLVVRASSGFARSKPGNGTCPEFTVSPIATPPVRSSTARSGCWPSANLHFVRPLSHKAALADHRHGTSLCPAKTRLARGIDPAAQGGT